MQKPFITGLFLFFNHSCARQRYASIFKTRRNRIYSLRLARRLAETELGTKPPPAPFAATLLPSREPGRLAGKPSAPALPPGSPYYRHKGWGRRSGRGRPTPTHGLRPAPAHPAGVIGPHPYPSPSGLAGGFVARRQPTLTIGNRGAGCGGQHPPGRGGRERTPLPLPTHRTGRVPEGKSDGGPPCPPPKIKTPSRGGLVFSAQP